MPQQALVVDEHGVLLDGALGVAGYALHQPGGRGRGRGEGREERVEVGIEHAVARVVRVARAERIHQRVVGVCGWDDEEKRAEDKDGEKQAVHGSCASCCDMS